MKNHVPPAQAVKQPKPPKGVKTGTVSVRPPKGVK